jgi:protein TonB
MGKSILLLTAFLLSTAPAINSAEPPQAPTATQPIQTFSATADGFQSQFNAILAAYRAGDNTGGRRLIEQFRLPRAEEWMTEHFGEQQGAKLTERYDRLFPNFADSLEKTILDVLRNRGANLVPSIGEGKEELPPHVPPMLKLSGITAVKKPALFFCRFAIQMNGRNQASWGDALTYEDGAFRFIGFGAPPFWVWEEGSEGAAPKGGSFVQPAVLVSAIPPVYPASARASGIEGVVSVHFVIDKNGFVKNVAVVKGDAALTQAAIDAVSQWRYKPATMGGTPVETDANVNLQFSP